MPPSTGIVTRNTVEELIRSRLGLADLDDPDKVIEALGRRYPHLLAKETQLSLGLPISGSSDVPVARPRTDAGGSVGSYELGRARRRLVVQLQAAVSHPEVDEDRHEFMGWQDQVLADFDDAVEAAEGAAEPDPRASLLGLLHGFFDKALIARMYGANATDATGQMFRLAASFDAAVEALLRRAAESVWAIATRDRPGLAVSDVQLKRAMTVAVDGLSLLLGSDADASVEIQAWASLNRRIPPSHPSRYLIQSPAALRRVLERLYRALSISDPDRRGRAFAAVSSDLGAISTLVEQLRDLLEGPEAREEDRDSAQGSVGAEKLHQGLYEFLNSSEPDRSVARIAATFGGLSSAADPDVDQRALFELRGRRREVAAMLDRLADGVVDDRDAPTLETVAIALEGLDAAWLSLVGGGAATLLTEQLQTVWVTMARRFWPADDQAAEREAMEKALTLLQGKVPAPINWTSASRAAADELISLAQTLVETIDGLIPVNSLIEAIGNAALAARAVHVTPLDVTSADVTSVDVSPLVEAYNNTIEQAKKAIAAPVADSTTTNRTPSPPLPPPPPFTGTEDRKVQGKTLNGLTRPTQAEPDPVPVPLRPDLWRALGKAQRALAEPLS